MTDLWDRHAKGESSWKDISDMLGDLHSRMLRMEGRGAEAEAFDAARKSYTDGRDKALEGKK